VALTLPTQSNTDATARRPLAAPQKPWQVACNGAAELARRQLLRADAEPAASSRAFLTYQHIIRARKLASSEGT
jgi:hypothetical protein